MSDDENKPRVGYGHPPEHTRFRPGQSGNPKGRPKGQRNFRSDLLETLKTVVRVKEKGGARTLTTQQAALYRLREKALNGDVRALNRLLDLAAQYNGEALTHDSETGLPDEDQAILAQYIARQSGRDSTTPLTRDDEEQRTDPPEEDGDE